MKLRFFLFVLKLKVNVLPSERKIQLYVKSWLRKVNIKIDITYIEMIWFLTKSLKTLVFTVLFVMIITAMMFHFLVSTIFAYRLLCAAYFSLFFNFQVFNCLIIKLRKRKHATERLRKTLEYDFWCILFTPDSKVPDFLLFNQ